MEMWLRLIEFGWLTAARLQRLCEQAVPRASARDAAQSTVEYALVGALVVIAAAGALTLLGGELTSVFTRISDTLKTAASAAR